MRHLMRFLVVIVAGACLTSLAYAAPVFQLNSGALTVTALLTGGGPTFDIRGAASVNISDTGLPASPLSLFDSTGGTDPNAAVLAFGNAFILVTDANTGASGIGDILFFDFAAGSILSPTLLMVPAIVSVTPPGSVPDAALGALSAASPIPFLFSITNFVDLGNGTQIAQWDMQQIGNPTPEPVSALLLGGGCFAIAAAKAWRTRRAQRGNGRS